MSNKRTHREYTQRKDLQREGIEVSKRDSVAFNSGSESIEHLLVKSLVAYVLKQRGFRVASEVKTPTGEIDVVAYGTEDPAFAVEVETGMDEEIIADKVDRYVHQLPQIRECFCVDPAQLPTETEPAVEWVEREL